MRGIRRVMIYGNLTFDEALNLPTDAFLLMMKNQYIEELTRTQEGREYLEKCERLKITEPDTDALKERFQC